MEVGGVSEVVRHWRKCRGNPGADGYVAAVLFRSHIYLCVCFGLSQGAVIAIITYATTFMSESAGSYCDGFFFGIAGPSRRKPKITPRPLGNSVRVDFLAPATS